MTIDVLPRQPMPSHPRRRDGRVPLPAPEERVRLRRAWRLTEEQVAAAFGVTVSTVRSWEAGRTAPTGLRRASYAAFLSGLAYGLVPVPAAGAASATGTRPARRAERSRRAVPPPAARPLEGRRGEGPLSDGAVPVLPGRAPAPAAGRPVGVGPDPVSALRLRRFRMTATAVGVWIVVAQLMATAPPPHW
ncbi:helix-turn-helix domain-containing protein [Streptomyces niveiscabiei]|uniref:helix-turn-helix domain-containing protein n=1 Tax=Streptomyces niveiscabiei TaxID=164115 RepID=UPI0029CA7595|nr:helix-turn-helix domain-containing protein [Streptomyces niveiscabiei]